MTKQKIYLLLAALLALVIIITIISIYHTNNVSEEISVEIVQDDNKEQAYPKTPSVPVSNPKGYFDIMKAKVGDEIVGMKIVSIKPFGTHENAVVSNDSALVRFTGKTIVTGTYHHYNNDGGFFDGEVCIGSMDPLSISKIPMIYPNFNKYFCFENREHAQKIFGPAGSTGTTTVAIDNYYIRFAGTEVWDTAELVEVIEK